MPNYMGVRKFVISGITLLCPFLLLGQLAGNHSVTFLQLSPSAHVTALGSKPVSFQDTDLSLADVNPAVLSDTSHRQLIISHRFFFSDISHSYAGYAHSLKNMPLTLYGAIKHVGYGDFIGTDVFGNEQSTFNASELAIVAGGSYQLYERLRLGLNLKFIQSSLESYIAHGLAADIGAFYNFPQHNLSFGLSVRNLGSLYSGYYDGDEIDPIPTDVMLGVSKRLKYMPFRFSVTMHHLNRWNIRYDSPFDDENILFIGEEEQEGESRFSKELDNFFRHLIFSGEFLIGKNDEVRLMLGYNHLRRKELSIYSTQKLAGFSGGISFLIKGFRLGYGLDFYHVAGAGHHLTLDFDLNRFMPTREI